MAINIVKAPWARALHLGALAGALLAGVFGLAAPSAVAASTSMVNLGTASTYAVLSGASIANTVSAPATPHTTLRGDLGVKANAEPTGFPPGVVTGTVDVGNTAAARAHSDLVAAYDEVAGRTGGSPLDSALAGATIVPGLHTIAGAVSNTATVTLDGEGDPNAVFVIQVGGAMAMAAGSRVVLTGGAQASRVFWQVNGAGAIGANAEFAGTLMALDAVAVGNRTLINGRAFARNGALTLDLDEVYSAPPVVTITGGGTAFTTDTTPTISGTTDVEAPAVITVTINGQILTATRSGASWSVTSPILANATYPVVASTSDGAGNPGSATQQLTVDTVLPVVTIDGGSSVMTNDPTPTIAGTSDVAPGTVVRVAVDSRTLTALVQYGGWWNVTATPVGEGTWPVVASAPDLAGNVGSARQTLTIATHPPAGSGEAGQTATPVQSVAPSVAPTPAQAARSTNAVAKAAVARRGSQKVKGSSLSIGTKVTAPTDGPVVATASGTVNIKGVVRAVRLTSATARVLAGGSVTLELKPKGTRKAATAALLKIKQATKKGTQVTATITVRLLDAAGNTREVTRTVKLTK